jgi:hypothetical protein
MINGERQKYSRWRVLIQKTGDFRTELGVCGQRKDSIDHGQERQMAALLLIWYANILQPRLQRTSLRSSNAMQRVCGGQDQPP